MSLFKILRGASSRISTETTPFHDGYAYFTPDDGAFYIDANNGEAEERIRINSKPVLSATQPTGQKANDEWLEIISVS